MAKMVIAQAAQAKFKRNFDHYQVTQEQYYRDTDIRRQWVSVGCRNVYGHTLGLHFKDGMPVQLAGAYQQAIDTYQISYPLLQQFLYYRAESCQLYDVHYESDRIPLSGTVYQLTLLESQSVAEHWRKKDFAVRVVPIGEQIFRFQGTAKEASVSK